MKNISLYIHFPFCMKKCPYCSFNSYVVDQINFDLDAFYNSYLLALQNYLDKFPFLKNRRLKSIFFGGGTPSLMYEKAVGKIIEFANNNFTIDKDCEISLEVNPATITMDKFRDLKVAGINRVSVGVQSLNNSDLKFLGRIHNSKEALACLNWAEKIFNNVSADFIYDLPHHTEKQWRKELALITSLHLQHYSMYQLTIEEGTPFCEKNIKNPAESESLRLFEMTRDFMKFSGRPAYEISNFAEEGYESVHNKGYWSGQDYIGIGAGAHGRITDYENGKFYSTEEISQPIKWLNSFKSGNIKTSNINELSDKDRATEIIITSLRTKDGLDLNNLQYLTNQNPVEIIDFDNIELLERKGLVKFIKGKNNLIINEKGFALLNSITEKVIKD